MSTTRKAAKRQAPPRADRARTRRLHATLLGWYLRHGRTLPWRGISNPYRILLSEIMLQQTQVQRVLEKYPEFLRRFPTLGRLASARQRDVVVAWRGMGYNNRAVRLHRLARTVVGTQGGRLPRNIDALMKLPGIGRYTANALLSSAFGAQVPVVDVNVQRVLSRVYWKMKSASDMKDGKTIWSLAERLLPDGKAYEWNQALMDLGATICTARTPPCTLCPIGPLCASRGHLTAARRRRLPRPEPSRDGIPNRIYRGRIVEELRKQRADRSVEAGALAWKIIRKERDVWFWSLLQRLEKDGVITLRGTGNPEQQRVALA